MSIEVSQPHDDQINPAYLEQLRNAQKHIVEHRLVQSIQSKILHNNSANKRNIEVSIATSLPWESTIEYFRMNGFHVSPLGRDDSSIYDEDGNEVYLFTIYW